MFDPTDEGGSFADRGPQYTSAIYYQTEEEKELAQKSKDKLNSSGKFSKPIATPIERLKNFFPAEDRHQNYYKKNSAHYKSYRFFSGRESFVKGQLREKNTQKKQKDIKSELSSFIKPSQDKLKKMLTVMQFKVTQENGTEPPFDNPFWDNKEEGIYVDIVSKEPLFSSKDKFDSGTGWPSFTKPLEQENIVTKVDNSLFMTRTEVRSRLADSHLGHVFPDGPEPTGLRYCINSAALDFIPKEELEEKGYKEYLPIFKD